MNTIDLGKRIDSEEKIEDIIFNCNIILKENGFTTKIKNNRIYFFQKTVDVHNRFSSIITLINGIGEGVLVIEKDSTNYKIIVKQKFSLHGFVIILLFSMIVMFLSIFSEKRPDLQIILISIIIILPLSLIGIFKSYKRTKKIYKILDKKE